MIPAELADAVARLLLPGVRDQAGRGSGMRPTPCLAALLRDLADTAEAADQALADHRERLAPLRGMEPPAYRSELYAVAYRRALGDVLRHLDLDVEPPLPVAPETRALSAAVAAHRARLGIPQREYRPDGMSERAMSAAFEAARKATEGTPDA